MGKESLLCALKLRFMLLPLLLACAGVHAGVPEAPRFRLLGVSEGVPHTTIVALARDRAGYLWLATHDGLARYDGVGFKVWRHVPGDATSLPRNVVQAMHIDARDRIWVATEGGGISVLDAQRSGFRHYRMANHPQIGSDDTWALTGRGDTLWFGTYGGGLHRLDPDGRITRFMPVEGDPRSLPAETILALAFDARGRLWVGTPAGVVRWTGHDFVRVALPGADPAPLIYSLTADGEYIWVGAANGVFRIDGAGAITAPEWAPMFERPNALLALVRDRDNGFWLASQHGLWRVGADHIPSPVRIGPDITAPVLAVLQQPDNALWTHVPGVGLGYLRSDWRQLAEFRRSPTGLTGEQYHGIVPAADGGFWLTGNIGVLERLDAQGRIERMPPRVQAELTGMKFRVVVEDANGRLWLGHRLGLMRIDRHAGRVLRWGRPEISGADATLPGALTLMALSPDGRSLWTFSTGGGVQQRAIDDGRVLRSFPGGPEHGLVVGDLDVMRFAPDGSLWIAGQAGIAMLDPAGSRFVPVAELDGKQVFALDFDDNGALWLQRLSGLERWQRDGRGLWKLVDQVGNEAGIPAVESGGLRIDRDGRVWLSTPRGLYRWDPAARHVQRFGVQHGLSGQEFVKQALALDDNGVLAAALADGGLVLLDTRHADPQPVAPDLRLHDVALRRAGQWQSQPLDSDLQLGPEDRELRVRMRLLAFDDPSSNRYWSRLEGFDQAWVAQGASGERVFSGLAAGDYVLHMRASDAAGNAAPEQSLRFAVLPPWWRTSWAYAGFIALAVLLLWALADAYRRRLKRRHAMQLVEHKRELAEQASLAKTRFLATLGHEVRTPMTGVLGMSELLLGTTLDVRQRGYTQSIRGAGEHLLRLVNDALDLARIEAGKLALADASFDLHVLADEVAALMTPLALDRGLHFESSLADDAPRALRGDATRVKQILLNLIGNAIKFTERGSVALRVSALAPEGACFEIRDTGPGLNEEQKARLFRRFEQAEGARTTARYGGSGLGLAISQELAAAMDGRIQVDSTPGEGTCFTVELPLPASELAAPDRPTASAAVPGNNARTFDLLLVEDDPIVAEVIAGLLRARGHRVRHAAHGLAALAEVASTRFDAALLDLDLPGIDGFALARQLHAQGFAAPMLAITARADADAEPQAMEAGFDAFLRKPLTGDMLADALEGLLPEADTAGNTANR